MNKLLKKR